MTDHLIKPAKLYNAVDAALNATEAPRQPNAVAQDRPAQNASSETDLSYLKADLTDLAVDDLETLPMPHAQSA